MRRSHYAPQCGAKLFRVTEDLRVALRDRFVCRWAFDVELIARFCVLKRGRPRGPPPASAIYELPLQEWTDVAGSKVPTPPAPPRRSSLPPEFAPMQGRMQVIAGAPFIV